MTHAPARPVAWLSAGIVCALLAASASAERRTAVVVGEGDGGEGTRPLRHAQADAERIWRILSTVGGVAPADATLLQGAKADDVLKALERADARADGGTVLFYYSGHAKDGSLRLGRTHLPLATLRERLSGLKARLKIAILDSCRSGEIIRAKGATAGPAFEVSAEPPGPQGVAILASSAADEDSQESDLLGASFFTHFLASGLLGDADADQDAKVTLQEAYAYAYARTVAQTAEASAGLQHPTYAYTLAGAGETWLTDLARATSALVLPAGAAGRFVVVDATRRALVAEIDKPAGTTRRVALPPGRYEIKRREGDGALYTRVRLSDGETTTLDEASMERVALARNLSKGADWAGDLAQVRAGRWTVAGTLSRQVYFGAGAREGYFPDLTLAGLEAERRDVWDSPGWVLAVDFSAAVPSTLEVRVGSSAWPTRVSQLSLGAAWQREFDLGRWTPFVGGRLTLVGLRRTFEGEAAALFPPQGLVTAAPGIVAGLTWELARHLSLGVRGRASYLLYRTDEDLSLGFGDVGVFARWEP